MQDDNTPCISFRALARARSTIEDFALSYFPLHGLRLPEDLLKWLDILVFAEATIYQLDENNEDATEAAANLVQSPHATAATSHDTLSTTGVNLIRKVLAQKDLMDERIEQELQQGLRYWQLELQVCRKLAQQRGNMLEKPIPGLDIETVLETSKMKSFDYRLLHLLLHALQGKPYDELLLRFTHVDEQLVDIGDDLVDYEDDVQRNCFNIYRCFLHLYGREADLKLIERIIALEKLHEKLLAQLPEQQQSALRDRQKIAGQEPGASRWVFPQPIWDEGQYRQEL